MHARYYLIILFIFSSISLSAQVRFGVDLNYRMLNKPVNAGILHHFIQARNYTTDTLQMRWVKRVIGNPPAVWTVNFADPEQNRPDISQVDSANFFMPDSTNWVYNKFVIGVNPNGVSGNATWRFNIFELQNAADSLQIEYEVIVTDAIGLKELNDELNIYPNPASQYIFLNGWPAAAEGVLLFNSQSQVFDARAEEVAGGMRLAIGHLPKGIYFISLKKEGKLITKKIIIQ